MLPVLFPPHDRYRQDRSAADHAALPGSLRGLPCRVMVRDTPRRCTTGCWRAGAVSRCRSRPGGPGPHGNGLIQPPVREGVRGRPCRTERARPPARQAQSGALGRGGPQDAAGRAARGDLRDHGRGKVMAKVNGGIPARRVAGTRRPASAGCAGVQGPVEAS